MTEFEIGFNKGYAVTQAVGLLRFLPARNNYVALVTFPYEYFQVRSSDPNKRYERGEVFQDNGYKYLAENDNISIAPDRLLHEQFKLFRDSGKFDEDGTPREWTRGECCLKGFERWHEDTGNPTNTGWWCVISEFVDNNTPPPNDAQNWEKVPE